MSVIVRILDNIRKCSLRVWTIFVSDGSNNLVVYDKNINPCDTKDVYLLKCMQCVYPSFKHCVIDDDYIASEVILGI